MIIHIKEVYQDARLLTRGTLISTEYAESFPGAIEAVNYSLKDREEKIFREKR